MIILPIVLLMAVLLMLPLMKAILINNNNKIIIIKTKSGCILKKKIKVAIYILFALLFIWWKSADLRSGFISVKVSVIFRELVKFSG